MTEEEWESEFNYRLVEANCADCKYSRAINGDLHCDIRKLAGIRTMVSTYNKCDFFSNSG